MRLIPAVFRILLGFRDPIFTMIHKRWSASAALDVTLPDGISLMNRIGHLLFVAWVPFIHQAILPTDLTLTNNELRASIASEFTHLLSDGLFLGGNSKPELADFSACPQVIIPFLRGENKYFLPGKEVANWADRMKIEMPGYKRLLPEQLLQGST